MQDTRWPGTKALLRFARRFVMSADTDTILRVYSDLDAPLYFALAHKTGPDTLGRESYLHCIRLAARYPEKHP
jgi:hypothetical protein